MVSHKTRTPKKPETATPAAGTEPLPEPFVPPAIEFETVPVGLIDAGRNVRPVTEADCADLAASIRQVGLLNHIVGGESGPKCRPCSVNWINSIVSQCFEARVPCFVKQLGGNAVVTSTPSGEPEPLGLRDSKGGNVDEWPHHLRHQRRFPPLKPAHAAGHQPDLDQPLWMDK